MAQSMPEWMVRQSQPIQLGWTNTGIVSSESNIRRLGSSNLDPGREPGVQWCNS